jgi:hypothetical protein
VEAQEWEFYIQHFFGRHNHLFFHMPEIHYAALKEMRADEAPHDFKARLYGFEPRPKLRAKYSDTLMMKLRDLEQKLIPTERRAILGDRNTFIETMERHNV